MGLPVAPLFRWGPPPYQFFSACAIFYGEPRYASTGAWLEFQLRLNGLSNWLDRATFVTWTNCAVG